MFKALLVFFLISLTAHAELTNPTDSVNAVQSGTWTVQQGTPPWSVSQSGTWSLGRTWNLSSGSDSVAATQSGTWTIQPGNTANTTAWLVTGTGGTFPATQSGTWNLNNISGTISLPTGASTSALQTTVATNTSNTNTSVQNIQGSVGAGTVATKSALIGGQYNTAAPTPTNGQQVALQLDSSGNLKTTVSGSPNVNVHDGAGNSITSDNPGTSGNQRMHVATPDTTTASTTLGALNASVSIAMSGLSSAGFQINSGTFIGTLQPQCSMDGGSTWASAGFYNPGTNNVVSSYVFSSANTTTVLPMVALSGASHCRVTVSAYTSGTANALMRASQVTGSSGTIPAATSLSNFFYDDMNVANGGIARATNFVVGTLTTLYTHAGSGTVYGFTLNLSGLGGAQVYLIDLQLDGNHIFGTSGISTGDLLNNALYDISQVTTDTLGFAGWAFPDKAIRWTVPGGGFVSYSNSVTVSVKQTAGGAGKFNAGLMALTR